MINRALFKQSSKANAGIWGFVTSISCAMIAIVILVLGNLNVSGIRNSMVKTFVKDAIESSIQKQSVTYFNMTDQALITYENEKINNADLVVIVEGYKNIRTSLSTSDNHEQSDLTARETVTATLDNNNKQKVYSFIDFCLIDESGVIDKSKYDFDSNVKLSLYILNMISDSIYNQLLEENGEETANNAKSFIETAINDYVNQIDYEATEFAANYIPRVLKDVFINESFDYQKDKMRISDYFNEAEIEEISRSAIAVFRAESDIARKSFIEQIENDNSSLSTEEKDHLVKTQLSEYKETYIAEMSGGFLDELPEDVATALKELGGLDIYALVIGEVFYRMAGMLLPMVFVILCANNLIASQVDTGSMAYILSTPTKRKVVAKTQMVYLIMSVFVMCLLTTITSILCMSLTKSAEVTITQNQLLLFNVGFFITLFAISGICLLSSCWFNRSKVAIAVGGGISIFFLMITILGLFGLKIIPTAIRIDAMNFFNHISLLSLFDTMSIINGATSFIWKWGLLVALGIITYTVGIKKFVKKDLPL